MLYPDFNELVALKERKSRLKLPSKRSVKSTIPGDHHSPFRGQGLEFDSVREYVPGDDIRNIDWRVTARTGTAHLKLFREERERQVILCVDMNASMRFGTRNTFKSVQAARAGAFLAWKALAAHNRVGACLYGDVPEGMQFFAPKRTRASIWSMLKLLTEPVDKKQSVSLEEMLRHIVKAAHTGSLVYIISDFLDLDDSVEHLLSKLNKRCDVVFIAVNDRSDKEMYPLGTLNIQGEGGMSTVVNTDSLSGRKTYAAQWIKNRKQLRELTRRLKIAMLELSTESDIPRDLVLGLKMLAGRTNT